MERILVIRRLNFITFIFAFIARIFRFEIYFYQSSNAFRKRIVLKIVEKLSLQKIDFQTCSDIGVNPIFGMRGDYTDEITDELFEIGTAGRFAPLFSNVEAVNDKLKALYKKFVISRCDTLYQISIWLNGNYQTHSNHHSKIYFLGGICKIREKFLLKSCNGVKVIPVFSSNFYLFFDIFLGVIGNFHRLLFRYIYRVKDVKGDDEKSSIINSNIDISSYEVLFFPHQSIFYGDLFVKDHFYSENKRSVFYPSNILHVEFTNIFLDKKQREFYDKNEIKTTLFPKSTIRNYCRIGSHVLKSIGLVESLLLLRKNSVLFYVLFFNSCSFLSKMESIKSFSNAKIALVGYEILFPPVLSMALESSGVKTAAVQERFMAGTFYENWGFILDNYFCNSDFSCKQLGESKDKFINFCIPCGQVRTDLLKQFEIKVDSNDIKKNLIVAFDYHSVQSSDLNRTQPIINWKANKAFYKDLCKLAEKFPDVNIVIRGKNINWTKNSSFKDVLIKINNLPNIDISADFDTLNEQYKLASEASLIIAKHTSIADELIAIGKPTLFYDFLPNAKKVISRYFDYNNPDIFVHSYRDLEQRVRVFFQDGEYLTEFQLFELQKIINNGPADGKVKKRIMSNLDALYIKTQSPKNNNS